MMRLRRASAIVTLCLLTIATSSRAECTWVVWRQKLSNNPAFPTTGRWIPGAT